MGIPMSILTQNTKVVQRAIITMYMNSVLKIKNERAKNIEQRRVIEQVWNRCGQERAITTIGKMERGIKLEKGEKDQEEG